MGGKSNVTDSHRKLKERLSAGGFVPPGPRLPRRTRVISLNISEKHLEILDTLVERGCYPSRSETIRLAVRDLLLKHGKFTFNGKEGKARSGHEA